VGMPGAALLAPYSIRIVSFPRLEVPAATIVALCTPGAFCFRGQGESWPISSVAGRIWLRYEKERRRHGRHMAVLESGPGREWFCKVSDRGTLPAEYKASGR
jgi:hypothetical protein